MIEEITRTVYYAPTKLRCYLTKSAAINAEARALIEAKYPTEKSEDDPSIGYSCPGWHWSSLERSDVLFRRVRRMVAASAKAATKGKR